MAACDAMNLSYVGYLVKKGQVQKQFLENNIDVLLVTQRPKMFDVFLKPFAKAE